MPNNELVQVISMLRETTRSHVTPEFISRNLSIPVPRAVELVAQLVHQSVLGAREHQGYPVCRDAAAMTAVVPISEDTAGEESVPSTPDDAPAASPSQKLGVQSIALNQIDRDPAIQPRATLDHSRVLEYARHMKEGASFPPIVVFYSDGRLRLADGFHRCAAALRAKLKSIQADVRHGTAREALLYAVSANVLHGLPLTLDEKRTAAKRLLSDEEWGAWSSAEIGRRCGLSAPTVEKIRSRLDPKSFRVNRKCRGRNGQERTINVANLGGKPRDRSVSFDDPSKHIDLPLQSNGCRVASPSAPTPDESATKLFSRLTDMLDRAIAMLMMNADTQTFDAGVHESLSHKLDHLARLLRDRIPASPAGDAATVVAA